MLLVHLASSRQHSYSVLIWQIQPVGVVVVERSPWDWEVVSLSSTGSQNYEYDYDDDRTPPPCFRTCLPQSPIGQIWEVLGLRLHTVKVRAKTVNQRSESDKAELLRPIVGFMISWPGRSKEYKTVPTAFLLGSEHQGLDFEESPSDCQASPKWFLWAAFACLCAAGDSQ